jgi:hypothetical protein
VCVRVQDFRWCCCRVACLLIEIKLLSKTKQNSWFKKAF